MYLRLVRFSARQTRSSGGPGSRVATSPISEQKGCNHVSFFGNETEGEYGTVVHWETQEDADAAAAVIQP